MELDDVEADPNELVDAEPKRLLGCSLLLVELVDEDAAGVDAKGDTLGATEAARLDPKVLETLPAGTLAMD